MADAIDVPRSPDYGLGVATLKKPGTVMGYYGSKTRAASRIVDLLPRPRRLRRAVLRVARGRAGGGR